MSPSANIAFPRDRSNPRSSCGADATGAAGGRDRGGSGIGNEAAEFPTDAVGATGAVADNGTCGRVAGISLGTATGGNAAVADCCGDNCLGDVRSCSRPADGGTASELPDGAAGTDGDAA